MSLAIDVSAVTAIMVGNVWHKVAASSFVLDAYEFVHYEPDDLAGEADLLHGGGAGGITSSGYQFRRADDTYMAGPLSAVQAVAFGAATRKPFYGA